MNIINIKYYQLYYLKRKHNSFDPALRLLRQQKATYHKKVPGKLLLCSLNLSSFATLSLLRVHTYIMDYSSSVIAAVSSVRIVLEELFDVQLYITIISFCFFPDFSSKWKLFTVSLGLHQLLVVQH